MKIELLVVPDCPNARAAADSLHQALDGLGLHDVAVRTRTITGQAEAEAAHFTGSPTILIDGRDPFAEPGRAPGLTCRMYRTRDGLAGAPAADQLRQALTSALQAVGRTWKGERADMSDDAEELAGTQQQHWQNTYTSHPGMYGEEASAPAVHAAQVFRAAGVKDVLELGAGHGRDALFFAREGFTVRAADFSPVGLEQLRRAARSQGVAERVTTVVHDVRKPLPLPDASVDAVFAHMLLCMALSTQDIHVLVAEARRVLRPGGVLVYTVRHTGDSHYGAGTAHGDDIYEHGGFAVHFFPRSLVDALADGDGWTLEEVHAFEEGDLPRRLWRVTQTLPR